MGAGYADRVDLRCGDAAKLPFENDFFDAVFMSFTLELFDTPEIPIVLRECHRVLRSCGRMVIVSMTKKHEESIAVRFYEWARRRLPNYMDCRPIFVREAIAAAGFQVLETKDHQMLGLPMEVVRAKKESN